jgi:pimeloyl-ACP methyl ester carboxylesterase
MVAYFRKQHEGLDQPKLRQLFDEMIGPQGKPETRRRMLEAAARMDIRAFAALRESMADVPARDLLARFHGPKFAIEVDEPQSGRSGSSLPGVKRLTIPNVSHWLMMDDPEATNRAFDQVLS